MRKYYMSYGDFSEFANVIADNEQNERALTRMTDLGLLTDKGNPSPAQISRLVKELCPQFLEKLQRRLTRRRGGILAIYVTLQKLQERKEFTGMFLFLALMYGFVEWQVPERISLLPAHPDALKSFLQEFMNMFQDYLESPPSSEEKEQDDSI